jgi:hypothetical protein
MHSNETRRTIMTTTTPQLQARTTKRSETLRALRDSARESGWLVGIAVVVLAYALLAIGVVTFGDDLIRAFAESMPRVGR